MPGCRYVEEINSAAMLAAKRLAGVTPEVNLRECITHTPLPSMNKADYSGFQNPDETSPEVQNRSINGLTKGLMSS